MQRPATLRSVRLAALILTGLSAGLASAGAGPVVDPNSPASAFSGVVSIELVPAAK